MGSLVRMHRDRDNVHHLLRRDEPENDADVALALDAMVAYQRGGRRGALENLMTHTTAGRYGFNASAHHQLRVRLDPTLFTPKGLRVLYSLVELGCISGTSLFVAHCPLCRGVPSRAERSVAATDIVSFRRGASGQHGDTAWRDRVWRAMLIRVLLHPLISGSADCITDLCAAYNAAAPATAFGADLIDGVCAPPAATVPLSAVVVAFAAEEDDAELVRKACMVRALAGGLRNFVYNSIVRGTLAPQTAARAMLFNTFAAY